MELHCCSAAPLDDAMTENDIEGKNIFELPEDTGILRGAKTALENLKIL